MVIRVGPTKHTRTMQDGQMVTDDGFSPSDTAEYAISQGQNLRAMSRTDETIVVEVELQFGRKPYIRVPVAPDDDPADAAREIEKAYHKVAKGDQRDTDEIQRAS